MFTFIHLEINSTEMEESMGQQYALQVAVQTMKERCLQLQERLSVVEEENTKLRMKHNSDFLEMSDPSKAEVEMLKEKIAQLTKQKSQLTHNVLMVATENRHLWNRLSKLTQANQTLGNQLTKINDTLNQGSPAVQVPPNLIRSKTFTHEAPPKIIPKLNKEIYVDSSLKDISLKILNNIAQEKTELEKQCAQMTEITTNGEYIQSSIGFAYLNDESDNCDAELVQHQEKLNQLKEQLLSQREKLKNHIELFKRLKKSGVFCKTCQDKQLEEKQSPIKRKERDTKLDKKIKTTKKSEDSNKEHKPEQICPMCSVNLSHVLPAEFFKHVENHFASNEPDYFEQCNYEFVQ